MEFKFTLSNFTKNVFSFIFIHKCSLKQKYIVFKWCHCWNIWYLLVIFTFFRVSYSVDHLLGNVKILNESTVCLTPLNELYRSLNWLIHQIDGWLKLVTEYWKLFKNRCRAKEKPGILETRCEWKHKIYFHGYRVERFTSYFYTCLYNWNTAVHYLHFQRGLYGVSPVFRFHLNVF